MSWLEHHQQAEQLASEADITEFRARNLYRQAAEAEARALKEVKPEHHRTRGITAVSAAALYLKAGRPRTACAFAQDILARPARLPEFAKAQLREIIAAAQRADAD